MISSNNFFDPYQLFFDPSPLHKCDTDNITIHEDIYNAQIFADCRQIDRSIEKYIEIEREIDSRFPKVPCLCLFWACLMSLCRAAVGAWMHKRGTFNIITIRVKCIMARQKV